MQQEQPCEMPYMPEGPGAHQPLFFLESSSNPSSSCKDHHNPAPPCCGQNQQHGQPQWPQMGMDVGGMHAQQWQYDPCCHQQYPGQPVFPWAPPHFFPGGMTPYR